MFNDIKSWLKDIFGHVASIINARLTALAGFVVTMLGVIDWSPLVNLVGTNPMFTKAQVITLGAMTLVKGIFDEILRRANDPVLKVIEAKEASPEIVQAKKDAKKLVEDNMPKK